MRDADHIQKYLSLAEEHPEWFAGGSGLNIIMDEMRIREAEAEQGIPFGITFDNSPYWLTVRDLVEPGFGYARVLYPARTSGCVCIPRRTDGKYGLLRIFRHAPRIVSLEFPRGFNEANLSPEENIKKELSEEMNASAESVKLLGTVRQDTGLCNGAATVYLAVVTDAKAAVGHEGIEKLFWLSRAELFRAIRDGQITDGFTLSSLMLLHVLEEPKAL